MPKKKGKLYFTKVHEDAIIQYSSTDDREEKTKLYVELINPAFNEMVDKIVYTYKFTTLPNIEDLKSECKVFLTTILDKFDPSKGSKAFSYFSVITKNWFIHKVKRNTIQNKREVYYDEMPKDLEQAHMSTTNHYFEIRESKEFWSLFWDNIDEWEKMDLKENERKVLGAIKQLFESSDNIEIFNKKAIYFYIREITGLNTKQVVGGLNRLRQKYSQFKTRWDKDGI
tara:strand:+ start:703 stop:1383 length:681 start_codon:yes stop_codon:yes gene_type:complete